MELSCRKCGKAYQSGGDGDNNKQGDNFDAKVQDRIDLIVNQVKKQLPEGVVIDLKKLVAEPEVDKPKTRREREAQCCRDVRAGRSAEIAAETEANKASREVKRLSDMLEAAKTKENHTQEVLQVAREARCQADEEHTKVKKDIDEAPPDAEDDFEEPAQQAKPSPGGMEVDDEQMAMRAEALAEQRRKCEEMENELDAAKDRVNAKRRKTSTHGQAPGAAAGGEMASGAHSNVTMQEAQRTKEAAEAAAQRMAQELASATLGGAASQPPLG